MIHVLEGPVTDQQVREMLAVHESYIKVAVDIQREILAGGGEFHADCESVLIETGSHRKDVWGADWIPDRREARFTSLINIRPRVNRGMEIQDPAIRQRVETITRKLFERA